MSHIPVRGRILLACCASLLAAWVFAPFLINSEPASPVHAEPVANTAGSGSTADAEARDSFLDAVRDSLRGRQPVVPATPEASAVAVGLDTVFRFTVALEPPQLPSADQKIIDVYAGIYASFVSALSGIPYLVLIESDVVGPDTADASADFVLRATGSIEAGSDPVWSFSVDWTAEAGTGAGVEGSVTRSQTESNLRAINEIGADAALALRRYPFPPDTSRTLVLIADALDTSLADERRFAALDELRDLPRRFEFVGMDVQYEVSVAAAEIVANAADPDIRVRTWLAIWESGIADEYLIDPLTDALLHDDSAEVRIEAARILSRRFDADTRVQSALEHALTNDASGQIRGFLNWESLDEAGRSLHVQQVLLASDSSAMPVFELLQASPGTLSGYVNSNIANRVLSREMERAQQQGGYAGLAGDLDAMLPQLSQILQQDDDLYVRMLAASVLVRFADDERARQLLETAMTEDESVMLRNSLARFLRR